MLANKILSVFSGILLILAIIHEYFFFPKFHNISDYDYPKN